MVAARLTSERPGSVIPLSKNIYCTVSAFIATVTADVCETDGEKHGGACAVLIHSRLNQPGIGVRSQSYGTKQRTEFSLCLWTRPQELLKGYSIRCLQHVSLGWPLTEHLTQYACYNIDPSNIGTTGSGSCCMLTEERSEGMVTGRGILSSRVHNLIIRT